MGDWRSAHHRYSTLLYRPGRRTTALSWIGEERIAIGNLPTGSTLAGLPGQGVTHVLNCRARVQTWISQDLAAERALFGADRVVHVSMWDLGLAQHPRLWSAAAHFAAGALDDRAAGVLIHCHQGRRRSIMVAYAVLRLRGHPADAARDLISAHRAQAQHVPAYARSVERWLAAGASPVRMLR
jgi:hypothetical protein